MAKESAIQTYQHNTIHEDLTDIVTTVTPAETPFLSDFGRGPDAKDVVHSWSKDSLAAPGANKHVQGDTHTFTKRSTPSRELNYTQIIKTPIEVSRTVRKANTAGYADEFARQKDKGMKEHARDIEYAYVNGTGASGASGTASELRGVLDFIETNVSTAASAASGKNDSLDSALQSIWTQSGFNGEYTAYVPAAVKRTVSAFTTGATKFVETKDKRLTNNVEIYESPFGIVRIKLHRFLPGGAVVVLNPEYWKTSWFDPTHTREVAYTSDSDKSVIISEVTLEARAEETAAYIKSM